MEHTQYVYEPECACVGVRVPGVRVCVWTCDMRVCGFGRGSCPVHRDGQLSMLHTSGGKK